MIPALENQPTKTPIIRSHPTLLNPVPNYNKFQKLNLFTVHPSLSSQMLPKKLKQNLSNYSEYKQQQTLHLLQNIKIPYPSTQQTIIYFNEQLQNIIQCGFYDIICNDNVTDLCSLLHLLSLLIGKNQWVRLNGLLFLVGSAVQILEGRKLRLVLEVFQTQMSKIQNISQNDRHKLHRIINEGLKKLQKTPQNSILRGKLHILMTNILKLAHKSGLTTPPPPPQHPYHQHPTLQQYNTIYNNQNVPYKTYISYFHIYNRLQLDIQVKQRSTDTQNFEKYLLYQVNSFLSDLQILLQRFYQINAVHVKEADDIGRSLLPTPLNVIKFVDDCQFRVLVLLKIVVFVRGVMAKVNGNVGLKVQVICDIRSIIGKIQASCLNYIKFQMLLEDQSENLSVLDFLAYFQSNQKKWLQIKAGNMKNIIKFFAPSQKLEINKIPSTNCSSVSQPEKSMQMVAQVSQQASTIAEHEIAYRSEVLNKLGLTTSKMQKFLSATPVLNIKKQATDTSFLYYMTGQIMPSQFIIDLTQRQSRQDLTDFDNCQDYTIIRWKAMRSLMKQKLSAITDPNFCRLFKAERRNLNKDFTSYQQTEVE